MLKLAIAEFYFWRLFIAFRQETTALDAFARRQDPATPKTGRTHQWLLLLVTENVRKQQRKYPGIVKRKIPLRPSCRISIHCVSQFASAEKGQYVQNRSSGARMASCWLISCNQRICSRSSSVKRATSGASSTINASGSP